MLRSFIFPSACPSFMHSLLAFLYSVFYFPFFTYSFLPTVFDFLDRPWPFFPHFVHTPSLLLLLLLPLKGLKVDDKESKIGSCVFHFLFAGNKWMMLSVTNVTKARKKDRDSLYVSSVLQNTFTPLLFLFHLSFSFLTYSLHLTNHQSRFPLQNC